MPAGNRWRTRRRFVLAGCCGVRYILGKGACISGSAEGRMNSFAPWNWSRLTAGVALTLVAGVLLAPSTARASCGDYVLMAGSHALPRTEPMQYPIDTPRPAHPAPADKKLPCSGPL